MLTSQIYQKKFKKLSQPVNGYYICYLLVYKNKFFEIFLNDLQTASKEYQKKLKKVGILRFDGTFISNTLPLMSFSIGKLFLTSAKTDFLWTRGSYSIGHKDVSTGPKYTLAFQSKDLKI